MAPTALPVKRKDVNGSYDAKKLEVNSNREKTKDLETQNPELSTADIFVASH